MYQDPASQQSGRPRRGPDLEGETRSPLFSFSRDAKPEELSWASERKLAGRPPALSDRTNLAANALETPVERPKHHAPAATMRRADTGRTVRRSSTAAIVLFMAMALMALVSLLMETSPRSSSIARPDIVPSTTAPAAPELSYARCRPYLL